MSEIYSRFIVVKRKFGNEHCTLGDMTVYAPNMIPVFKCITLERGWNQNIPQISCIPEGLYDIELEYSNAFKKNLWELKDVLGRSEIKIHNLNHWYQSKGCIGVGRSIANLDFDNIPDITSSVSTLRSFHKAMGGVTKAKIQIKKSQFYNGLL